MHTEKGFGLLGFLLAVLVVGILMTWVLTQYTKTVSRAADPVLKGPQRVLPGKAVPARSSGKKDVATQRRKTEDVSVCDGKRVGNICVPTRMHSGQDNFDRLYR